MVEAVIIHATSVFGNLTGTSQADAGVLLQHLVFGGIPTALCFSFEDSESAVSQQKLLSELDPPEEVLHVSCQACNMALALRTLVQRMRTPIAATILVAAHTELELITLHSPQGCQLLYVQGAATPEQAHTTSPASDRVTVLPNTQALLRHVVWSHAAASSSFVIAYVMKRSRSLSLAKRGFFPLLPTDGLSFLPLHLEQSISEQGPFTAILHKASDMLELDAAGSLAYNAPFQALIRYQANHATVPFIDPLPLVQQVLDRLQVLLLLRKMSKEAAFTSRLRGPRFLEVPREDMWPTMMDTCAAAGLNLPCLVKSVTACGLSAAHAMTLVLRPQGWHEVECMIPAVVQEYVDHAARLFKVYVIASEVHIVEKQSLPDLGQLSREQLSALPASVPFDSLAGALPKDLVLSAQSQHPAMSMDKKAVEGGAQWLQQQLGLSIFGFDVVIQQQTGDHIIIDINYFPSFKEVVDAPKKMRLAILRHLSVVGA